jgi:hypothetical protein
MHAISRVTLSKLALHDSNELFTFRETMAASELPTSL